MVTRVAVFGQTAGLHPLRPVPGSGNSGFPAKRERTGQCYPSTQ